MVYADRKYEKKKKSEVRIPLKKGSFISLLGKTSTQYTYYNMGTYVFNSGSSSDDATRAFHFHWWHREEHAWYTFCSSVIKPCAHKSTNNSKTFSYFFVVAAAVRFSRRAFGWLLLFSLAFFLVGWYVLGRKVEYLHTKYIHTSTYSRSHASTHMLHLPIFKLLCCLMFTYFRCVCVQHRKHISLVRVACCVH